HADLTMQPPVDESNGIVSRRHSELWIQQSAHHTYAKSYQKKPGQATSGKIRMQPFTGSEKNGSGRAVHIADHLIIARRLKLIPDQHAVRLFEQQRADNEGEGGDGYRIVEARINIAGLRHDRQPDERQQSAEDAVADVIRQRQGRVPNL